MYIVVFTYVPSLPTVIFYKPFSRRIYHSNKQILVVINVFKLYLSRGQKLNYEAGIQLRVVELSHPIANGYVYNDLSMRLFT